MESSNISNAYINIHELCIVHLVFNLKAENIDKKLPWKSVIINILSMNIDQIKYFYTHIVRKSQILCPQIYILHGWSQLCPGHNCVLKVITKRECTHYGGLVKFF